MKKRILSALMVLCLLLTLLPVSTLAAEEGTGESDPAINQDGSDLRKDPAEECGKQEAVESGPPMNRMGPVRQMSRGLQGIQRKMSRQRFREIPLRVRIPRPPRSLRESWIP